MTNHELQIVMVLLLLISAGISGHLLLNDRSWTNIPEHDFTAQTISDSNITSKSVVDEATGSAALLNKCEIKYSNRSSDLYNLRIDIDQHAYAQMAKSMTKSSATGNLMN